MAFPGAVGKNRSINGWILVPIHGALAAKPALNLTSTIKKAIEELVQLNQGQKYSYGRDTLVKMVDEALAANP